MIMKILGLGNTGNISNILKKYLKNSQMDLISFENEKNSRFNNLPGVEYFESSDLREQLKLINKIKHNYNLCLVTNWAGARLAYLSGLNFIFYFLGTDIRYPPFKKIIKNLDKKDTKQDYNFFERRFYKKILQNAIYCVAVGKELHDIATNYREDTIRLDRIGVDKEYISKTEETIFTKNKFLFFSPQRIDHIKGIDIIWEAIKMCKSDFEVLQVDWYSNQLNENPNEKEFLLDKKPKNVKLIPIIPSSDIFGFYHASDAVIGQVGIGVFGSIEREAALCKKPVMSFSDPKYNFLIDDKIFESPFLPKSNNPEEIAKVLDEMVLSKKFRDELVIQQNDFIKELSDPDKWAIEWEKIFEKTYLKIKKQHDVSNFKLKIRWMNLILAKIFEEFLSKFKGLRKNKM